MKENILEAFSELGFKLEEEKGLCYSFTYEGLNLLYIYNENDEEFFSIALPHIMEVEEDKMLHVYALLEEINTLKYVKAYCISNTVWLLYEREFLGEENMALVISHMILHLESGLVFARKAMAEIEGLLVNDSADKDNANGTKEIIAEETVDNDNNE